MVDEVFESIPGIIAPRSPFPEFILQHQDIFKRLADGVNDGISIIDIGAGAGRFMAYFLSVGWPTRTGELARANVPIRRYVAIEPDLKRRSQLEEIARRGRKIQKKLFGIVPKIEIKTAYWEDVREEYVDEDFDVTILWEVLMFMDLTEIHEPPNGLTESEAKLWSLLQEVRYWCGMTNDYILLALFPVKNNVFGVSVKELRQYFRRIVSEFLKYTKVIAKKDWKYILEVI